MEEGTVAPAVFKLLQLSVILFGGIKGILHHVNESFGSIAAAYDAMQHPSVGRKDQIGRKGIHRILLHDSMCIGVPAFHLSIVFGGGIQLHFYVYEFVIKIIPRFSLRKNNGAHMLTEAAPGGKTIHKDILVLCLCFS